MSDEEETREEKAATENKLEFQFERIEAKLALEVELINHRMNWLLISQAFILAGYIAAVLSEAACKKQLAARVGDMIAILGVFSSAVIFFALISGLVVAVSLRDERFKVESELVLSGYCHLNKKHSPRASVYIGAAPPLLISLFMFVMWGALFSGYSF